MKAIVTTRTDHTNVYGYISVEPMTDTGLPMDESRLPQRVRDEMREQYPSVNRAAQYCDRVAEYLRKLGWTVLNGDADPYFDNK